MQQQQRRLEKERLQQQPPLNVELSICSSPLKCASCGLTKNRLSELSKTQLSKGDHSRCRQCISNEQNLLQQHRLEEKEREQQQRQLGYLNVEL